MKPQWRNAVLAGMAAGSAMLACLIVGARQAGMNWDQPSRWMAAFLVSEPALILAGQAQGGMSAPACLVLGLAIHLIIAGVLAGIFLMFTSSATGLRLLLAAILYSALIWAAMRFALLPMFDAVMYARVQLLQSVFFGAHLVYGLILAAVAARIPRSTHE
jgi:hypothetical protein